MYLTSRIKCKYSSRVKKYITEILLVLCGDWARSTGQKECEVALLAAEQAFGIWACLSLPSILVTLVLYFYPESDDDKESRASDVGNVSYRCYENLTVYHPVYLEVRRVIVRLFFPFRVGLKFTFLETSSFWRGTLLFLLRNLNFYHKNAFG